MSCLECGGHAKAKEETCLSCDGEGNSKKAIPVNKPVKKKTRR